MAAYAPIACLVGTVAGAILHYHYEPLLEVKNDKIFTVVHATLAIVGAAAVLVMVIGGKVGLIASSIPLFASLAVGSGLYRAYRAF